MGWYFLHTIFTIPGIAPWCPLLVFLVEMASLNPEQSLHTLQFSIVLRTSIVLSTFAHEWIHVVVAMCCGNLLAMQEAANWRCNVSLMAWAWSLFPLSTWHDQATNPHICYAIHDSKQENCVRIAGAMFSVALAFASTLFAIFLHDHTVLVHGAVLGTWMVAAGAVVSDVFQIDYKDGTFRCGNFGMLVINTAKKHSVDCFRTLERMVAITSARGAQSGGIVTLCKTGAGYRCRFVPTKRQDLSVNLLCWFSCGLHLRNFFAWCTGLVIACFATKATQESEATKRRLRDECQWFVGHTRFATSSAPTVQESHPHRFVDPRWERVWRCDSTGAWHASMEKLEVYITHNGDFDFWTLFGRLRTHADMGLWLQTVLKVTNTTAACDSTKISGVMQYLRTQGMWLPSFRLAYQNVVQPPFECYFAGLEMLPAAEIQAMASTAEDFFSEFVSTQTAPLESQESITRFSTILATKLAGLGGLVTTQIGDCMDLAAEATRCFLGNDLFTSLKFLLENAHGSFGLAACCTLDPNVVALASRGQPMSLALDAERGVVLWGSEASAQSLTTCAQMVSLAREETSNEGNKGPRVQCQWRHDLEEARGEVVELIVVSDPLERDRALHANGNGLCFQGTRFAPMPQQPSLLLRVYLGRDDAFATRESFCRDASLVGLLDNPHVDPLPPQIPGPRRVAADIQSIPAVLGRIRVEWDDPGSRTCQTAGALFEALHRKACAVSANQCGRLEIDVLVIAVEASLWIGEQFASDLQGLFPRLRVVPLSANKICGVFSNHQGADAMTGFSFSSTTMALKNAVVIAISHSGQTFPTMHATHALRNICGDTIFVVAGSIDSKMSAAVSQMAHDSAPWVSRVIPTFAGWRPAEALTVSTVACHHTLTELLLFLGGRANESEPFRRMAGVLVSPKDIAEIRRLNFGFVTKTGPETVGATLQGDIQPTDVSASLRAQGRKWALHVLEGPHAWCLSAAYILGTVVSSSPPFLAIKTKVCGEQSGLDDEGAGCKKLHYVALALDSLVYMFLPLLFSLLLRALQGRELWARLGKRTLVVGDVPHVHQLLESYVSKLFALSYSIASIEVHGANPIDHLVHRFTHRVARGVLLAVGRPDGRLFSQTKAESWILMALQQAKAIVHLGSPPEIITVGHNPYHKHSVMDATLVLSQARPPFICETIPTLADEADTEPMKRMATFKHSVGATDGAHALIIDGTAHKDELPIGSYLLKSASRETKANFSLLQHLSAAAVDSSCHGLRGEASVHSRSGISQHTIKRDAGSSANKQINSDDPLDRVASSRLRTQARDHSMHRDSPWQPREFSYHKRTARQTSTEDSTGHSVALSDVTAERTQNGASAQRNRQGGARGAPVDDSSIRLLDSVVSTTGDSNIERALSATTHSLHDMLNHCTALETWYENRYASLERYMSMLVLFHAMADRVAAFLPLRFDTSRSQSQLRVATTAAPISAADIQHEWAEAPTRPLLHHLHPTEAGAEHLPAPARSSARDFSAENNPEAPKAAHAALEADLASAASSGQATDDGDAHVKSISHQTGWEERVAHLEPPIAVSNASDTTLSAADSSLVFHHSPSIVAANLCIVSDPELGASARSSSIDSV